MKANCKIGLAQLSRYLAQFKHQGNDDAALRFIPNIDAAGVQFDDFFSDREAETGAFAGGFGGEKRVKNVSQLRLRNTAASIHYLGYDNGFPCTKPLAKPGPGVMVDFVGPQLPRKG